MKPPTTTDGSPSVTTASISTESPSSHVAAIIRFQSHIPHEPSKERERIKPFPQEQWDYNRHLQDQMIEDVINAQSSDPLPGPMMWEPNPPPPEQPDMVGLEELPQWIPPEDDSSSATPETHSTTFPSSDTIPETTHLRNQILDQKLEVTIGQLLQHSLHLRTMLFQHFAQKPEYGSSQAPDPPPTGTHRNGHCCRQANAVTPDFHWKNHCGQRPP